jgi:hypothetical protein
MRAMRDLSQDYDSTLLTLSFAAPLSTTHKLYWKDSMRDLTKKMWGAIVQSSPPLSSSVLPKEGVFGSSIDNELPGLEGFRLGATVVFVRG